MQRLFNTIDTISFTPVLLFGVALFGIISLIQVLDNQSKDKFLHVNGKIVHNDYDSKGFSFFFGFVIFIGILVSYVLYKTYAA